MMHSDNRWMESAVRQLRIALQSQNMGALEKTLNELRLAAVCGNDFIEFCRIRGEDQLVILLSTLGAGNGVNEFQCSRILDLYQSVHHHKAEGWLKPLAARHVLLQALQICWGGKDLPLSPGANDVRGRRKSSEADVELAIELLLDQGKTASASRLIIERCSKGDVDEHKLRIAKILIKRLDEPRRRGHGAGDLGAAYACLRDQFAGHSSLTELRDNLALMMMRLDFEKKDWTQALQWCRTISTRLPSLKSNYFQAELNCRLGDIRAALLSMDKTFELMLSFPSETVRSVFRAPGGNDPIENSFDIGAARSALTDLRDVLEPIGHRPFLVAGTLLGYERVRDFLSHDKDIDVGLFGHEDCFEVLQTLLQSDRFSISSRGLKLSRTYNVAVHHTATGMGIDIFFYHREGDRMVTGVQNDFGYLQTFAFTPFDLKRIEFVGVDTWAPSDIDLNLQENFGNWRVPDPTYVSHVESPSVTDPGGDIHMLVARLQMFAAMLQNKTTKGLKMCSFLERRQEQSNAMSADLLTRIRAHFEALPAAFPSPGASDETKSVASPARELVSA